MSVWGMWLVCLGKGYVGVREKRNAPCHHSLKQSLCHSIYNLLAVYRFGLRITMAFPFYMNISKT